MIRKSPQASQKALPCTEFSQFVHELSIVIWCQIPNKPDSWLYINTTHNLFPGWCFGPCVTMYLLEGTHFQSSHPSPYVLENTLIPSEVASPCSRFCLWGPGNIRCGRWIKASLPVNWLVKCHTTPLDQVVLLKYVLCYPEKRHFKLKLEEEVPRFKINLIDNPWPWVSTFFDSLWNRWFNWSPISVAGLYEKLGIMYWQKFFNTGICHSRYEMGD